MSNSLCGKDKSTLLKELLEKCQQKKINVSSVTFDGDKSNQATCKNLGANFNANDEKNFKPYFDHPVTKKPVYVFFDACHMLKLVRNYFASKGPFYSKKDPKYMVKW